MELKIISKRGNFQHVNAYYKVKFDNKYIWIDPSKFDVGLLEVKEDIIIFKEPFDLNFTIYKNSNDKGTFFVLNSKNQQENEVVRVEEATVLYQSTYQPQITNQNNRNTEYKQNQPKNDDLSQIAKYEFLKKLISNKYLSKEQFDRLLNLSGSILNDSDTVSAHLPKQGEVDKDIEIEIEIDVNKHKPQNTKLFLSYFSTEGLKFLVHDYDVAGIAFDYDTVIKTCKQYFDKFSRETYLHKTLYARIMTFAFNNKENSNWFFNSVAYKYNWQHPELIAWCNNNPNISPYNGEIFYQKMILPFRQSIRIKERELWPLLQGVFTQKLEIGFVDFVFEKDNNQLDDADFYNDIEALIKGVSCIISSIKERKDNSNHIKVEYLKNGRRKYLVLTHVGSKTSKPLNSDILKGDLNQVVSNFYMSYHYSIKAHYKDEMQLISLLYDINQPADEFIKDYEISGFTHIITL